MITAEQFNSFKTEVYNAFAKKINEKALDAILYDEIYSAYERIGNAEIDEDINEDTVGLLIDLILKITDFPTEELLKNTENILTQINENIQNLTNKYNQDLLTLNNKKDLLREEKKQLEKKLVDEYTASLLDLQNQKTNTEDAINLLKSNIIYLSPQKAKDNLNSFKLITLELLKYYINSQTFIDTSCKGACLGSCLATASSVLLKE